MLLLSDIEKSIIQQ